MAVGTCIPYEHYYDADALPVLFYVTMDEAPKAPFLKYLTSKPKGEDVSFPNNTSDAKYFYAKIFDVRVLSFLNLRIHHYFSGAIAIASISILEFLPSRDTPTVVLAGGLSLKYFM